MKALLDTRTSSLSPPTLAVASNCDVHQQQHKRYAELRKKGGYVSQMNQQRKSYDVAQERYRACTGKKDLADDHNPLI